MKKHWLKIHGYWTRKQTIKAWENLMEYIKKYPESKITVYNSETSLYHKFFCLECNQNYDDLDIDCNSSFDGSLIHLNRKPSNLVECKGNFQRIHNIYVG